MTRPYRTRTKLSRTVSARVTALEHADLAAAAEAQGETIGEFMRRAGLDRYAQVTGRRLGEALAIFPFARDQEPES